MYKSLYSKNEKLQMRLLLFSFRLTLDFMYAYILQKEYNNILMLSLGYTRGAFSFEYTFSRIIVSYLLTILFIEIVIRYVIRDDRPHELICLGLLAISVLPNLTMFAFSEIEWDFLLYNTVFWIFFFACSVFFTRKISRNNDFDDKSKQTPNNFLFSKTSAQSLFWIVAIIFIIGSIALTYSYYGRFYINLSFALDDVYKSRLSARGTFGLLTNYFRNNSMYVVVPLLANSFLVKKRYGLFGISLVVLALLFSVDSQKAVLMLALVSMVAALVVKNKISKTIIKALIIGNIFVICFYLLTGNLILIDFLVKRIYFLPAIIGRCYYEYVGQNGNLVFLSSLLQNMNVISNYAYEELALPYLIGRHYFGSSSISANTGGFAGAYAYGVFGMVFIPIVYGFLFRLLDRFTSTIEAKYFMSFIVVTIFVIEGTTLTSVLLVYGFIVGLFMLYIMSNSEIFESDRLGKIKIVFGRNKKL